MKERPSAESFPFGEGPRFGGYRGLTLAVMYAISWEVNMSQCSIPIYMEPNAERNEVLDFRRAGVMAFLRLKIAVQYDEDNPECGNEEIISFLAQILGIGKGKVSILKGKNTAVKAIGIEGLDTEQVMEKLKPHMKA
jgi:uncharacterized protein YggU (UPF0235/DUF167 family)